MSAPTLCVIGAGRAGGSLVRQWHAKGGFQVIALHTRSGRPQLAAELSAQDIDDLHNLPPSDALMLATGDPAIASIAQQLAASTEIDWHNRVVFHISGALPASILQPLADKGAQIASAHPVRAFSDEHTEMQGTWVGIEGQDQAKSLLKIAFQHIGAQCFDINSEHKIEYHAAAVIASNHLIALAHASQRLWQQAGLDQPTAQALFSSLTSGVLQNLADKNPAQALTGPIARGDAHTISAHSQNLEAQGADVAALYRQLSRYLIESIELSHNEALKQQLLQALSDKAP